jgi:uracil-DNA glycosylase
VDTRRARLWDRLGLGPVWTTRRPPGGEQVDDEALAPALADQRQGAAVERMDWDRLEQAVAGCTLCGLCKSRTNTVFGVGNRSSEWMVIGEAPGAEEDLRGEPFVGQAGRLLDSVLAAAGLGRSAAGHSAVYIANVVKCRPPGNRNPEPGEVARCEPYLMRQIELLRPRMVLLMGRVAAQAVLGTEASIASLRGHAHRIDVAGASVPVIVTYHPAYLLRNLADKAKVWADLCLARDVFERTSGR